MFRKRLLMALLTVCLIFTSCFGFTTQVWAETAGNNNHNSKTVVLNGWHDGKLYDDGKLYTGWRNNKYYKAGRLHTGWFNYKYYVKGKLLTGIRISDEGVPIYYTKGVRNKTKNYSYKERRYVNGKLYTGWFNYRYYKSGKLYTGWRDNKYYKSGKLYTGWHENKYYKSGKTYTGIKTNNKGVPYYYVKGVKNSTKKYLYKNRYYMNGKVYTGIIKTDSGVFFYNKGVKSKTEIYTYDGKKYRNGKLYSGLYGSYYYSSGKKYTGYRDTVKQVKTGEIHYFKKDGSVCRAHGWWRIDGKRYYFENGYAAKGWEYIDGYKYYFHQKTGTLCQDLIACQGDKWKKADLKIRVNRQQNCVTIYAKDGDNGYIIPVKALVCSVGKKETPTITGTYTLKNESGRIYRWHLLGGPDMGGYVYGQYAVRINGGYMFHSVTYKEKDNRTFIASTYNNLGGPASHGCVRLQVIDAKLIYDIVKYRDTKVEIYDSNYVGPFDKPVLKKIPLWQNYEPTDPSI